MGVGENSKHKSKIEGDETAMAAIAGEENSSKNGNAKGAGERTSKSNKEVKPFDSKLPLIKEDFCLETNCPTKLNEGINFFPTLSLKT